MQNRHAPSFSESILLQNRFLTEVNRTQEKTIHDLQNQLATAQARITKVEPLLRHAQEVVKLEGQTIVNQDKQQDKLKEQLAHEKRHSAELVDQIDGLTAGQQELTKEITNLREEVTSQAATISTQDSIITEQALRIAQLEEALEEQKRAAAQKDERLKRQAALIIERNSEKEALERKVQQKDNYINKTVKEKYKLKEELQKAQLDLKNILSGGHFTYPIFSNVRSMFSQPKPQTAPQLTPLPGNIIKPR